MATRKTTTGTTLKATGGRARKKAAVKAHRKAADAIRRVDVGRTGPSDGTRDVTTGEAEVAAPLDLLLTQAALGPARRFFPGRSTLRFAGALARRPRRVATRAATLGAELGRIAAGNSDVAPSDRDRRFADPAWKDNPLLRRVVQAYLATGTTVEGLVQDVPLDPRDAERIKFAAMNLIDALAPSNNPLVSPVAWKAVIDTAGGNVITGIRSLVRDLASSPRVPAMVASDAYTVGSDLAVTPGEVVLRTPILELIQYRPQTETVRKLPVLIVPPTINKYYVLDLAPQRSLVEYLVGQGQQVFMISWRNPDARHSTWGFDTYVQAIVDAVDAVRDIRDVEQVHLLAACSGGMLTSMLMSHLVAAGRGDAVASLGLLVTVIDQAAGGTIGALIDEATAAEAVAASRRKGYLDGRQLAEVFAWLRPNDLVWNYWVNNYLQGRKPPAFDILFWNADTTRMAAKLHRDFVSVAMSNALTRPGGVTVLGTDVDLAQVSVDSYVVAGISDHICPWQACYRSTQLLGGTSRFILSTSGHIAALVNPPGNKKASYQVGKDGDNPDDAGKWQRQATTNEGSWWPNYSAWLAERSDGEVPAPASLGAARYSPLVDAPGSYILDT